MVTKIWVDGKRIKIVPQCAECGLVVDSPPPKGWEYVELKPDGEWGWLCPNCQDNGQRSEAERLRRKDETSIY